TYNKGYEWVQSTIIDVPNAIKYYTVDLYDGFVNVATTVTNVFVALFTFSFVLFFLLKDGFAFNRFFIRILPPKFRSDANHILHNMDQQVGSYIRGQIIVAICIGILLYIGYLIIGLDFAITLAIIAAFTSVVPYIGPIIAISPAIVIALVDSPF